MRARHRIRRQGPRPGFPFGAGDFGYARSEEYAKLYNELLNFATLPFYRNAIERVEGSPAYKVVEAILDKTAGTTLVLKAPTGLDAQLDLAGVPEGPILA